MFNLLNEHALGDDPQSVITAAADALYALSNLIGAAEQPDFTERDLRGIGILMDGLVNCLDDAAGLVGVRQAPANRAARAPDPEGEPVPKLTEERPAPQQGKSRQARA